MTKVKTIVKRDGRTVLYDETKIASAVLKAMTAAGSEDPVAAARVANAVEITFRSAGRRAAPPLRRFRIPSRKN